MRCPHCDEVIHDRAETCPYCNKDVRPVPPRRSVERTVHAADRGARSSQRAPTRRCPFCAEEIQFAAIVCKHCLRSLTDAAPPESFLIGVLSYLNAKLPGHQIAAFLIVAVAMIAVLASFSAPGGSLTLLLIGWLVAWGGFAHLLRESSVIVCVGGSFICSIGLLVLTASCRG